MTGILGGLIGSFKKAISWVTGTITNQVYLTAVYAPLTNGSYFAFGGSSTLGNTTAYRYSTDGSSWSAGTLPVSSIFRGSATNGSVIFVTASSTTTHYYSTNGTTWTAVVATAASSTPVSALWDGTRWILPRGSAASPGLYYKTDITSATAWSTNNPAAGAINYVAYDGTSRHIATFSSLASSLATTTTFPTGWASATLPSSANWVSPVFGNGIWLVMQPGSASYATSTNGTTWTSRTLPSQFSESSNENAIKMIFDNDAFYYYYLDNIYKSGDGINWITEKTVTGGTLDNANAWAVSSTKIVILGAESETAGATTYVIGTK